MTERHTKNFTTTRLKYIVDIFGRIGFRGYTEQDLVDEGEGAITLSPSNIQNMKMTYEHCSYLTWFKYNESPEIKIFNGDILFVKTGSSYGKTGFVEFLPMEATINPQLAVFKNIRMNKKLLFFILQIDSVRDQCENAVVGGTIPTMSQTKIGNIIIPFPSLAEQQRIADFLDCECEKIDGLKADIQSQIDILEQYKRSVITEAVMHGLKPDATMKDSGIAWVGEIPKTWQVMPLYCLYSERKNINFLGGESNLLSLSYGKVIRKDINTSEGLLPSNYNGYNVVERNDIIIRPTDLQNDKRSLRTGLVEERGIITSAYIALKPNQNANSKYYHYLLHSYDVKKVFYNMGNGVRQGLNYNEFAKIKILVPSNHEQQAIAEYLDKKCAEIEQAIADKKAQLDMLDEYKKSLIYEYVTGKKEVV